ncbi:MAG TPA: FISUMP domain-containing protein [bacterium]|nr:FISUMP domain-containing protein [bacterium]HPT30041.1 FISUMP domain-containing protein [bacterium]
MKKNPAFTLMELIIVVFIIGLIAGAITISYQAVRANARDTKRISDVTQIQNALELYHRDEGQYPAALVSGQPLVGSTSSTTYLAAVPTPPNVLDGTCTASNNTYSYSPVNNGEKYTLNFCLGGQVSNLTPGAACGTPTGLLSQDCCELFPVQYEGGPYDANGVSTTTGGYYRTVKIGDQCWLKDNLNVGTMVAGASNQVNDSIIEKYCYDDNNVNCLNQGGLYQWGEAMQYGALSPGAQGICPAGWHIPTDIEQDALDQYLTNSGQTCDANRVNSWSCANAGTKLRVGGTSHFEGILAGDRNTNGSFGAQGTFAIFWSSSRSGSNAWNRYLSSGFWAVFRYADSQANGFSVRCLKN